MSDIRKQPHHQALKKIHNARKLAKKARKKAHDARARKLRILLAKKAAKDLISGTIAKNRAKRKKKK